MTAVVSPSLLAGAVALAVACSAPPTSADGGSGALARGRDAAVASVGDAARGDAATTAGDAAPGDAATTASDAARGDAAADRKADDPGYRVDAALARAGGAVRVIVRWPHPPQARLRSPGENDCGMPRAPSVEPDVLWGLAEVMVILELERGKDWPAPAPVAIAAHSCALTPRIALARRGDIVSLGNRDGAIAKLRVRQQTWRGAAALGSVALGPARTLRLPWRGHRVGLPLPAPALWQIELDGKHGGQDAAWLLVPPHPYASITDPSGSASFAEVPSGEVSVVAWLPARGNGRAAVVRGTVNVQAGKTSELVLSL